MHPDQPFESELAARLDEIEPGTSTHQSGAPVTAEVVDLLRIAHQLRAMPPVEPDRAWMEASKRRLLARFEAAQGRDSERSDGRPTHLR